MQDREIHAAAGRAGFPPFIVDVQGEGKVEIARDAVGHDHIGAAVLQRQRSATVHIVGGRVAPGRHDREADRRLSRQELKFGSFPECQIAQ